MAYSMNTEQPNLRASKSDTTLTLGLTYIFSSLWHVDPVSSDQWYPQILLLLWHTIHKRVCKSHKISVHYFERLTTGAACNSSEHGIYLRQYSDQH
eukprot:8643-Heterococcus_DN1.PRE.1